MNLPGENEDFREGSVRRVGDFYLCVPQVKFPFEGEFSLGRDVTGNISAIHGTNGAILTKAYDPAGRLVGVKVGNYKIALGYDGFGRKNRLAASDGTAQAIHYDALNRAREIVWTKNFAKVFQQNLNYDRAGNPFEISHLNGRYDLEYDANNQLIGSRTETGTGFKHYNRAWEFDALGNRVQDSERGEGSFVANFQTADAKGRYQADQDGMGELDREELSEGLIRQYAYRSDGRMASVQDSKGTQAFYHHDPLGRVAAISISKPEESFTQSFLHLADSRSILYSRNGVGSVKIHVEGQGVNEHLAEIGSAPKTFITDHLGSVMNSVIAGNGQYGLFGETSASAALGSSASPVVYGFAGYQYDPASGQYLVGPRTYDPKTGRWGQQDPIGLSGGDVNLYRYVWNSPLEYVDPNGTDGINVRYRGYPVETPVGRLPLGHGAVVSVDPKTGRTRYYEYGRYDEANKGAVRRRRVPDLVMKDGKPTQASLDNLYKTISRRYGRNSPVDATYDPYADAKKINEFAEGRMNDPNRANYNLLWNNCNDFADDAIDAGRR